MPADDAVVEVELAVGKAGYGEDPLELGGSALGLGGDNWDSGMFDGFMPEAADSAAVDPIAAFE